MNKLFLTSTGLPKETRGSFLSLLDKSPSQVLVCHIPTAADPEEDKWFIEASKDEFKEIGLNFFDLDLKSENKDSLIRKLAPVDVIYINGGNTFYLLDWVRRSGFDKVVPKLLEEGKIYVGASAGTVLAGPDIAIAGWDPDGDKNTVGLTNLCGLNLVPFAIAPHFVEKDRKLLEEKSKGVSYAVVALNNKQVILARDEKISIVGVGEKVFFNNFKET